MTLTEAFNSAGTTRERTRSVVTTSRAFVLARRVRQSKLPMKSLFSMPATYQWKLPLARHPSN